MACDNQDVAICIQCVDDMTLLEGVCVIYDPPVTLDDAEEEITHDNTTKPEPHKPTKPANTTNVTTDNTTISHN
jgi:hypothetical protein